MDRDMLVSLKWFFGLLGVGLVTFGSYVKWFSHNPLFPERIVEDRQWADSQSLVFFALAFLAFASMYFARGWARELDYRARQRARLNKSANEADESARAVNRSKTIAFMRKDLVSSQLEAAAQAAGQRISRT